MEIHLKVCFSFLVHLAIRLSIAGAEFFTQPDSQTSTCAGIDLSLDWTINNEGSINTVTWSFNTVAFALKVGSAAPAYFGSTGITAAKVEYTTSGKIVIKNSVVADSGEYSCRVTYTGVIASASSTAMVAVVTAPSDSTLTITGDSSDTYTCFSDSTSVTVTIKVDNVDKGTNTYTGSVDIKVECCITGDTVPCMSDTSDTTYCKLLYTDADGCFSQAGCTAGVVIAIIYVTSWNSAIVVVLVIKKKDRKRLPWHLSDGHLKKSQIWVVLFICVPYGPPCVTIYWFKTKRPIFRCVAAPGADVSINCKYTVSSSGEVTVQVKNEAGTILVSVKFIDGKVAGKPNINSRIEFTRNDTTGDVSFKLNNIQTSDSGLYTLSGNDVPCSCVKLYVTDKPTSGTEMNTFGTP